MVTSHLIVRIVHTKNVANYIQLSGYYGYFEVLSLKVPMIVKIHPSLISAWCVNAINDLVE